MCGIFGVVSSRIDNPGEFYPFLSKVFVESQLRGRDASGFAAMVENKFITDKDSCDAGVFTELSKLWRSIRVGGQLSLIGHTRAATNGSPSTNRNNHPFHSKRYSMVHNGGIFNFEYIAKMNKFNLETDCDSELILHFLKNEKTPKGGIIRVISELEATSMMAVSFLDKNTGIVHLFRERSAPTSVVYFKRWNATVFASTLTIITNAATDVFGDYVRARSEMRPILGAEIPELTHLQLLPDGNYEYEDVEDQVDTNYNYCYDYSNVMWGNIYSGGSDKSEVNDDNSHHDFYSEDNNISYFRCIECNCSMDDSVYRGMIHEIGSSFMCNPCYTGDKEGVCSASSPPSDFEGRKALIDSIRKILPISMRLGIGNNVEQWAKISDSIEKERTPKDDYELDDFTAGTYISFDAMDRAEKLDNWTNMTLKRMFNMDDGEYLAYCMTIKNAIELVNV